jgi:protein TonB
LREDVVFKDAPAAAGSGEGVALQESRGKGTGPSDGLVHAGPSGSGKGSGSGYGAGDGGGGDGSGIGQAEFGGLGGPRFLRRELPEYPFLARKRKKEGTVSLMVTISANGRLMKVDVISASDEIFVGPSVEAVKKSTFIPASRNGIPVAIKAILPIRFALSDS